MESQAKTEAPAFVYDTLTPLSFSDSNQSPPLNQSPATHDDSHLYSVYRNEISDFTVETTTVESETVDFFSLDVDAGTNENGGELLTPVVSKKKNRKRKKDEAGEESRLESNWFSENSFSKIPMLQLHKGIDEKPFQISQRKSGSLLALDSLAINFQVLVDSNCFVECSLVAG